MGNLQEPSLAAGHGDHVELRGCSSATPSPAGARWAQRPTRRGPALKAPRTDGKVHQEGGIMASQEVKQIPLDPAIPPWDAPQGNDSDTYCSPVSTAAAFPTAKRRKQPTCPRKEGWIDKTWSIPTMEYYSALKTMAVLTAAATWTNLEDTRLSEMSWSQKHK